MHRLSWWLPLVLLALGAAGLAAACSGGESNKSRTLGSVTFNDHGTKDANGKSSLELEVDDYYYDPTFIKGTPGQTVTLEISSDSSTKHNFSITSQNIDTDIAGKARPRSK